ncbi:MAG: hypothetical protein KC618_05525, partial [Candidatus Omnitrophica bacterium]|nr:hypothetical protein [Candidatus Omnitrophota bacterium]
MGLSDSFNPVVLKGLILNPQNPFEFEFIIDTGDFDNQSPETVDEGQKCIDYFLTAITVPGNDLWVNLSPLEPDRIIPDAFGKTEMGRDLLAQDYLLKQLTSMLMSPDDEIGKKFWDAVYKKAEDLYGSRDVRVDMGSRVWIVPGEADVYVEDRAVYIGNAKLHVMLENDYYTSQGLSAENNSSSNEFTEESNKILRDIVIPMLDKEVNEGKNFAYTRQVYHSLILAKWYKETLRKSILSTVYADQSKVDGVTLKSGLQKEEIYQQYLKAFESGSFDSIKEEYDPVKQEIIAKKYFVGGVDLENTQIKKRSSDRAQLIGSFRGKALSLTAALLLLSAPNVSAVEARLGTKYGGPVIVTTQSARRNVSNFTFDKDTGFAVTHVADVSGIGQYGASAYSMAIGTLVAPGGSDAFRKAFLNERTDSTDRVGSEYSKRYPQTNDTFHTPKGGVYSIIQIESYGAPKVWDYNARAGDNAWLGISAIFHYLKTKDKAFLRYAMKRAEFLKKLQDTDGALRHAPRSKLNDDLWNAKATEDSQTAIRFFDMLYEVTGRQEYKDTADTLYDWVVEEMYNEDESLFHRGMARRGGSWYKDPFQIVQSNTETFNIATTTSMPLERMLQDSRFGDTREQRLRKVAAILRATDERLRVEWQGEFLGYAENAFAKESGVLNIEQSYSFAQKHLELAKEFEQLGKTFTATFHRNQYETITNTMDKHVRFNFNRTETVPQYLYLDLSDRRKERNPSEIQKFKNDFGVGWSPAKSALSST